MLSWSFVGRYKQNNQRWETKLSHKLGAETECLYTWYCKIISRQRRSSDFLPRFNMFLDVVSVGEMFKVVNCHPICFKKGTSEKKNLFSKMDFNHEIRWKQCKSCKCCPGHSDCQSLTLIVMIQVSQFVMNCQLCHSLCPNPRQSSKLFKKLRFSKLHINYFVLQSSMSLYFQLCTFFIFF